MIKQDESLNKKFHIYIYIYIEACDSPIEVWKTLASLFDKSGDVFAFYIENKIHDLDLKYFDRIE